MSVPKTSRAAVVMVSLGLALGACAQQPRPMATAPSMDAMQGRSMAGMDMQTMMTHCAQMRQQMRAGSPMGADMRGMMAQCDQMDRQMGGSVPTPGMRPM